MMNIENEWVDDNGGAWTIESFLEKMEWEGGIGGILSWGGASVFPPCVRAAMTMVEEFVAAIDQMEDE